MEAERKPHRLPSPSNDDGSHPIPLLVDLNDQPLQGTGRWEDGTMEAEGRPYEMAALSAVGQLGIMVGTCRLACGDPRSLNLAMVPSSMDHVVVRKASKHRSQATEARDSLRPVLAASPVPVRPRFASPGRRQLNRQREG